MRIFYPFTHRFVGIGVLGLLLLVLVACGGAGGSTISTGTSNTTPTTGGSKSTPTSPAGQITEFPVASGSNLYGITAGLDGNLWFIATGTNQIGRITSSGSVNTFPIPTPKSSLA